MTQAITAIQSRKQALIAECAAHREMYADAWRGFQRPIEATQRTVSRLKSPWIWATVGMIALKLPKKKLLRIPLLLWKGWKLFRRIRPFIR
jgi:hypothetical protein